jgi:hypothetical protein
MSRARHARAMGGGVKPVWNAGGDQNAAKEAEERKHGGKVTHGEGESAKHRADRPKRARGGKVVDNKATDGKKGPSHDGGPSGSQRYASGGRVRGEGMGADRTPLTTAAKVKHITPNEEPEEGVRSG